MSARPFNILIAALGGEGGSVLMNWIVAAARRAGFAVQATSVPGVAQRTGSTSYYIELLPAPPAGAPPPVFALVPMPGRVDVVLASELVEAGRVMERGFVSPTRTTLITSTSRVITTAEKVHGGDGRHEPEKVMAAIATLAQRPISLDLDALARAHGTLVSATLYGALIAADVLPFAPQEAMAVVTDARSRAGVEAARAAVAAIQGTPPGMPRGTALATANEGPGAETLPAILAAARTRLIDYQDAAYADLFSARVERLKTAARSIETASRDAVLAEAARRLALWMAYEDIPRVADLKSRSERMARIRRDAEATPHQLVRVYDYLKPGADEIAAMLPPTLASRINRRIARGKGLPLVGRGITLDATGVVGHLSLRALAAMKRGRRKSQRYVEEQAAIENWMTALERALPRHTGFARTLAELPRLLKGYGDTHARGRANYRTLFEGLVQPALADGTEAATAAPLRKAMSTALAEPERKA